MLLERIRSLFMEIMEIREISVSDFSLNFSLIYGLF